MHFQQLGRCKGTMIHTSLSFKICCGLNRAEMQKFQAQMKNLGHVILGWKLCPKHKVIVPINSVSV